jgi:hypothetical protein
MFRHQEYLKEMRKARYIGRGMTVPDRQPNPFEFQLMIGNAKNWQDMMKQFDEHRKSPWTFNEKDGSREFYQVSLFIKIDTYLIEFNMDICNDNGTVSWTRAQCMEPCGEGLIVHM